jgi:hypothetical protein
MLARTSDVVPLAHGQISFNLVAHPLAVVLLLVVCGTMADCDDDDSIAAWGATPSPPRQRRSFPMHRPESRPSTLRQRQIFLR